MLWREDRKQQINTHFCSAWTLMPCFGWSSLQFWYCFNRTKCHLVQFPVQLQKNHSQVPPQKVQPIHLSVQCTRRKYFLAQVHPWTLELCDILCLCHIIMSIAYALTLVNKTVIVAMRKKQTPDFLLLSPVALLPSSLHLACYGNYQNLRPNFGAGYGEFSGPWWSNTEPMSHLWCFPLLGASLWWPTKPCCLVTPESPTTAIFKKPLLRNFIVI